MKRLRQELSGAAERLGYKGLEVGELFEKVRNEKSQQFSSKNETLDYLINTVKKIDPKLNLIFGPELTRPEILNVNVKASPNIGGPIAYFKRASIDGRRKGAFYINLDDVAAWKRYEAMTITLHEANPGHNLQVREKDISLSTLFNWSPFLWAQLDLKDVIKANAFY